MIKRLAQILIILLINIAFVTPAYSKTLDEINQEIAQKQKELEEIQKQLEEAENQSQQIQSEINVASTDIESIKNDLETITTQIENNENSVNALENEIQVKELLLEKAQMEKDLKMQIFYIESKSDVISSVIAQGSVDNFWKEYNYRTTILDNDINEIGAISEEISKMSQDKTTLLAEIDVLNAQNESLASTKSQLEAQLGYLSNLAQENQNQQIEIAQKQKFLQEDIEGLTAEQKQLILEEQKAYENADNGGTVPLVSDEFYFSGRGREYYQGHGLGLSQYGAKGGAEKGMSAQQIATFYYVGSQIGYGYENGTAPDGQNIETYIAYLGEIPDWACGSAEQQSLRPDKYRVYDSNYWEGGCWPEEAIKAQIIVARSYALKGGTAQVIKPTNNKKWAVDETRGQVIEVPGWGLVKGYYSADNNNGWGTGTHWNPMWCWDFNGNCGSGYSWLQSVNDSSFAAKGPYTDWIWRTNSYSLADFKEMFNWYSSSGLSNFQDVANLVNTVGDISGFSIQRDLSGRASRVVVEGSLGSVTVNGDTFKKIFNAWVYNIQPSGEIDPIFSLTYYFNKV